MRDTIVHYKGCAYGFILLMLCTCHHLQGQDKYWVFFQDKGPQSVIDLFPATEMAVGTNSPASIPTRSNHFVGTAFYDLPHYSPYLDSLASYPITIVNRSKWLNAISAYIPSSELANISQLPFVKQIQRVKKGEASRYKYTSQHSMVSDNIVGNCDSLLTFVDPFYQLEMLELDSLHALGFRGGNIKIAVFDNGFLRANEISGLAHVFQDNRILATKDFVEGDEDVFEACEAVNYCQHGELVWSILAANIPGTFVGSAPDASYILLRTENDASETPQEEDNWVAAAEFADSMGANIFSTSLGYFDFDDPTDNYTNSDLNGEVAVISVAADIAASKGIIVVNSAGNDGLRGIVTPADGKNVLAIGAVNACGEISPFSSRGPTSDGRIKPDFSAMGERAYYLDSSGQLRQGNGTSLSCPLFSGMVACLIQAVPDLPTEKWKSVLQLSSNRMSQPDNTYGYGIPSAVTALRLAKQEVEKLGQNPSLSDKQKMTIFPNPLSNSQRDIKFNLYQSPQTFPGQLNIISLSGSTVFSLEMSLFEGEHSFQLPYLASGMYVLEIKDKNTSGVFSREKFVIIP